MKWEIGQKRLEEIEDEIFALEQIRVADAFLGDSSHSTRKPYASTAVSGTEQETDSGVISERPSDFHMSLREGTRVKETSMYNGARPKIKMSTP